jgi:hypothetical protein
MNYKFVTGIALAFALAITTPAFAAKKKKSSAAPISGVYCEQGGNNVFITAAEIKPSVRNKLRKGQRFRFNYPGFGPISCVGY